MGVAFVSAHVEEDGKTRQGLGESSGLLPNFRTSGKRPSVIDVATFYLMKFSLFFSIWLDYSFRIA